MDRKLSARSFIAIAGLCLLLNLLLVSLGVHVGAGTSTGVMAISGLTGLASIGVLTAQENKYECKSWAAVLAAFFILSLAWGITLGAAIPFIAPVGLTNCLAAITVTVAGFIGPALLYPQLLQREGYIAIVTVSVAMGVLLVSIPLGWTVGYRVVDWIGLVGMSFVTAYEFLILNKKPKTVFNAMIVSVQFLLNAVCFVLIQLGINPN